MRHRRAIGAVLLATALLVVGRIITTWVADGWIAEALGVGASDRARRALGVTVRTLVGGVAALTTFATLIGVRRSIVSVVLPRQFGDLVIGEAVPTSLLSLAAGVVAAAVGVAFAALPPDLMAVQSALDPFVVGEVDPYWGRDLGFYWGWLPFEAWVHDVVLAIWATATAVTALLYVATPSVHAGVGGVRVAPWPRRHLGLLIALGLLLVGWTHRIARYDLLAAAGPEGFGLLAHRVEGPILQLAAWTAVPAAVLFAWAAWYGRGSMALGAVAIALVVGPVARRAVPPLVAARLPASERAERESTYAAVRDRYRRRALDDTVRLMLASQPIATPSAAASFGAADDAADDAAMLPVAPGAGRYAVLRGAGPADAAPPFGRWSERAVLAWALRAPGLAARDPGPTARLMVPRDPVERVRRAVPFLTPVGAPRLLAGGGRDPRWAIDLVVAADRYPMVPPASEAFGSARYVRRAGTAVVDARTGEVRFAASATDDPLVGAWRRRAPEWATGLLSLLPEEAVADVETATSVPRDEALRVVADSLVAARRRGDWRAALTAEARLTRLVGRRAP